MRYFLSTLVLLMVASPLLAASLPVGNNLVLEYSLIPGWEMFVTAPPALLEKTAEHITHEAEARGQNPSPEQALEAARKRLAANEGIIYHVGSGSHLDVDFSPLGPGERPPSADVLRKSADYAVQSLASEEGVHDVQATVVDAKVNGAQDAFRIEARYRHHDEPVHFIGLIGSVDNQWFFFYFTAPGADPGALAEVEQILRSLRISPTP